MRASPLLAFGLATLCSCGAPVDVAVPGDDARVVLTGAAELDDDGARFRFSSAGLQLRFRGRLRFVVDDGVSTDDLAFEDGGNRFAARVVDDGGSHDVEFAGSSVVVSSAVPATLSLVKKTEAFYGAARVVAVVVEDGELLPPPPKKKTMLVLGDSFSTGFGILGDVMVGDDGKPAGPRCPPSPDNMDVTRAWPMLVGAAVDHDVALIGWSGRGVLRDWEGDERPLTVPELWNTTTLANDVDGAVVALGGNDFEGSAPDLHRFNAAWRAMVLSLPPWPLLLLPKIADEPLVRGMGYAYARPARPASVVGDAVSIRAGEGCLWHPGTRAHAEYAAGITPTVVEAVARWSEAPKPTPQ